MNLSGLIFLSVIALFIGAAIGSLIERGTRKGHEERRKPSSAKEGLAREGDLELFSVWRTSSNKVWLEMEGSRLEEKEALLPEQKQRLLSAILDLRPWLEGEPAASANPSAVPPAPVTEKGGQGLLNVRKKASAASGAPAPVPIQDSIIEQIDKVLQIKLSTSQFKGRGIKLMEGPGGLVLITDGANRYEGLDAIPNEEIKAIIRQAVSDWEKGTK